MWRISFWQKNIEELKVEERRCLEQRGPSVLLDQNIRKTQILNTAQTLSGWRWCAGGRMKKDLAGFAQKENMKVGLFR